MKKIIPFLIIILLFITCKEKDSKSDSKEFNNSATIPEKNTINKTNVERPKQSKISNFKYNKDLLFEIWTHDPNGPHADFEISKEYFYIVDYDENANIPYIINHDTIKVFYNDFISVGIINMISKDTLKIKWDDSEIINYVKWKG